jgi:hypothetical protein
VTGRPYVTFDYNSYRIPADLLGRPVEILADLNSVRVLHERKVAMEHDRAWSHGQVIS